jgi:hypothetical protein
MATPMKYLVRTAHEGTRGFDANQRLSAEVCAQFVQMGYDFAIRYVRRATAHSYDLSQPEVSDILRSGLGLMVVQHVAPPGWMPNKDLGTMQGTTAVREIQALDLPEGTMTWCDLEEVGVKASLFDIVAYCNAWYDVVKAARLTPGLYVGSGCGLSGQALYRELRFQHYWAAYNLNRDEFPSTRGVCMVQRVAKPEDRVSGLATDGFDVDLVLADHLGGLPVVVKGLCL